MSVRVLIVDDDPMVCRTLALVLSRGGFDVSTACDAIPALETAEKQRPNIAVVDYNMPTCGLAVVRELKERLHDDVFVAILTGDDHPEMRETCLSAGADAVLIKPIAPDELRRRLSAAAVALQAQLAAL